STNPTGSVVTATVTAKDASNNTLPDRSTVALNADAESRDIQLVGTQANSLNVRSAIEGIEDFSGGPLKVTGLGTADSPWIITFAGAAGNVAQLSTSDTGLQQAQTTVETITEGSAKALAIQTITVTAGDATVAGSFKLRANNVDSVD